jgi:pre-mRNA-splicing factor RBM22/SLT11
MQDDFPILCETCLGQNPYVRMVKLPYGHKLCKISNVPYQGFRWKAGQQGRYKETIISHEVAAHRNICQACLNDMKYGLPVGVRDALLQQEESQKIKMPASNVGSQYFYSQVVANAPQSGMC